MDENSEIEWCDHTFNPWKGCTKISPACDNCYAEDWDKRFYHGVHWGPHAARRRTKTWAQPLKWNKKAAAAGVRYRVFCASLADIFDNHSSIQPEWRTELWELIKATPHLDWLILTKRPQNIHKYLPEDWGDGYDNVALGTTVENQIEADRRIPWLLGVRAKIYFLSCEPLLAPINLEQIVYPTGEIYFKNGTKKMQVAVYDALRGDTNPHGTDGAFIQRCKGPKIDWVIAGGENHKEPREMQIQWVRSLRDQCAAAGTPFLFKQWHGTSRAEIKVHGRALDGVVHDGYPLFKGVEDVNIR